METTVNTVVNLTAHDFKELVFDYEKNTEWNYNGKLPAIIDFYADWCGPCKMVAPVLQEIAKDYADQLVVYKVNTENEQELASVFGIRSIPTILFVPTTGKPQAATGALPRASFDQAIKEILLMK